MANIIKNEFKKGLKLFSATKEVIKEIMSDNLLESIRLKKNNKIIVDISKKQHNSIMELICLVREISEKLQETNNMSTRSEMKDSLVLLNDLILLRLKRAKNYVKLTDQQIDSLDWKWSGGNLISNF